MTDQGRAPQGDRWAGSALVASALGFACCLAWAAFVYPGGTWCEPEKLGYDLLRSFFCDLLHARGLNGEPNPAAPLARAGLLFAALGFIPFWLGTPRAFGFGGGRALWVRGLGVASALGCLAVASTPSDRWPVLHQVSVLSASTSGVLAALLVASAPVANRAGRWLRVLAWAALGTAALDAGLYAEQVFFPKPCAVLLPALQKLAALWILAWMLGTAWVLLRGRAAQ